MALKLNVQIRKNSFKILSFFIKENTITSICKIKLPPANQMTAKYPKGGPFAYSRGQKLLTLQYRTLLSALWAWLSYCAPFPTSALGVQMLSSSQVLSTHHTFQEGSTLQRLCYQVKRSCWWKSLYISEEAVCISWMKAPHRKCLEE